MRPTRGSIRRRCARRGCSAGRTRWAACSGIDAPRRRSAATAQVLGGNRVLPGMQPYAARYGGHQFGNWAGQLGDGRAITLGEVIGAERRALRAAVERRRPNAVFAHRRRPRGAALFGARIHVQRSDALSRRADDARAEPRWPPARRVVRDMFYDGNPEPEPGAIVCRVAPTFVRFGNFEILAASEEHRRPEDSSRTT